MRKIQRQQSKMEQREIFNANLPEEVEKPPTLEGLMSTFGEYFSKFPEILKGADDHQFYILKKKYRFYLTKLSKFQSSLNNLKAQYQRQEQKVLKSQLVQEALGGIGFVEMVSAQTISKLAVSGLVVQQAKYNQKSFRQKIIELKKEVNTEKNKFFKLKRQQSRIRAEIQAQRMKKYRQNYEAVFRFARDSHKKHQQTIKRTSISNTIHSLSKLEINSKFFTHNASQNKLQKIQLIENMKKEFMILLKKICGKITFSKMKNINRFGSISFYGCERKQIKLKINQSKQKSMTKKQSCHKLHPAGSTLPLEKFFSQQYEKENLLTTAQTFEVFTNLKNEKMKFREIGIEDLMKLICQKGKISEVLNIIQKEKKDILK